MVAHELINKHNLRTASFLTEEFWSDMTLQLSQAMTAHSGRLNPAVRDVKRIWDKMALHSGNSCLHNRAWNYFYATRIAPLKPSRKVYHDKKKGWFRKMFGVMFMNESEGVSPCQRNSFTKKEQLVMEQVNAKPPESKLPPEVMEAMQLLGLTIGELTVDFVLRKYRSKTMKVHPDKGGTAKMFHAATTAKTLLLNWVKDGG
jgi:hypothetical protein